MSSQSQERSQEDFGGDKRERSQGDGEEEGKNLEERELLIRGSS